MNAEQSNMPWYEEIKKWHDEIDDISRLPAGDRYKKLIELSVTNPELLVAFAMGRRDDRLKLAMLAQMDFTIWACDENLNIKLWDGSCPKLYQLSKESVLGKNYLELFVNPIEQSQSKEDTLRIIETGVPQHFRYCEDVDGRGFPIQAITQCCRVFDDDGSPLQAEMAINMNYDKLIQESQEFIKRQKKNIEEIEEARSEMIDLVDSCRKRLLEASDSRSNYYLNIREPNTHSIARKAAERIIEIRREFNIFFQEQKERIKTEACFCDTLNYKVASEDVEAEYTFHSKPNNSRHIHSFNCIFRHNKRVTVQWREFIERQEVEFQSKLAEVNLMMYAND